MGLTPEQLKEWAKKNNKFLKLSEGESVTIKVLDVKTVVKDSFGQEKEVVRYNVELEDGSRKVFENGSIGLAALIADKIGKVIILSREGEGIKTKYFIKDV